MILHRALILRFLATGFGLHTRGLMSQISHLTVKHGIFADDPGNFLDVYTEVRMPIPIL